MAKSDPAAFGFVWLQGFGSEEAARHIIKALQPDSARQALSTGADG
jgi:hypothetical protein